MGWQISKEFSFCYGHRVWVQKLNESFCAKGDTKTKCRHLHGHEGLVRVVLKGDKLNPQAMLCDFKEIGWLKDFLDNLIDHKFILDTNDPEAGSMLRGNIINNFLYVDSGEILPLLPAHIPGIVGSPIGRTIDTTMLMGSQKEIYDGYFLVDFIPTSENLAFWLFTIVKWKMAELGVETARIEWNETPKSQAVFEG